MLGPSESRWAEAPLRRAVTLFAGLLAGVVGIAPASPSFAESYTLSEAVGDSRVFRVESHVDVQGQLETATGKDKAVSIKLDVGATQIFLERRLSGTGRGAQALRSLRSYRQAEARIEAGDNIASSRLRDSRRAIVAQGRPEGVEFYCPAGTMNSTELELLQAPGDGLAALSLLPQKAVEIGESWKTPSWVIQMLSGTEAVLKNEMSCTLQSVTSKVARVTFEGSVEGATVGASTEIKLVGHFLFDLQNKYLQSLELRQTEKRSVGAVSPGMDVAANVKLTRSLSNNAGSLTKAAADSIPLEPDASLLLVELRLPWGVNLLYDRHWHVFHTTQEAAVLRLMEKGSLAAQCNVTKVNAVQPGHHTPEIRFQNDIRTALGEKLTEIARAEELQTNDEHYRYRVTALGTANGLDMSWIYYLCTAPSGQQAALVFAFESKKAETLADRDLRIVKSLQFVNAKKPFAAAN